MSTKAKTETDSNLEKPFPAPGAQLCPINIGKRKGSIKFPFKTLPVPGFCTEARFRFYCSLYSFPMASGLVYGFYMQAGEGPQLEDV